QHGAGPPAAPALRLDAGLDREAHAGLERSALSLDYVRRLVGREADAVPSPVQEALAERFRLDHALGRPVDLLAGDPRPDGVEASLLRAAHDVVHAQRVLRGSPTLTVL